MYRYTESKETLKMWIKIRIEVFYRYIFWDTLYILYIQVPTQNVKVTFMDGWVLGFEIFLAVWWSILGSKT